ncbi:hypothetical protein CBL_08133 [Carabus blaptoides fortunei]
MVSCHIYLVTRHLAAGYYGTAHSKYCSNRNVSWSDSKLLAVVVGGADLFNAASLPTRVATPTTRRDFLPIPSEVSGCRVYEQDLPLSTSQWSPLQTRRIIVGLNEKPPNT